MTLTFRTATLDDVDAVLTLVRIAYRGEEARATWTSEADLLDDQRIDAAGVRAKIDEADGCVLLASSADDPLVACCEMVHKPGSIAYFGMFAVRPSAQSGGLGRAVLSYAEGYAVERWAAATMEMTVIGQRTELIDWYLRRGYHRTGETRPFPYDQLVNGVALRDDLYFDVLAKDLTPAP